KRLFLVARCDGHPIAWPQPTHGPGTRRPYRTAAECIDWSIPMLSIFATREEARAWARAHGTTKPVRPLAEATMRRIARGVVRYVLEAAEPFIVPNNTNNVAKAVSEPLPTITGGGRNILVAPYLVPRYGEDPHRNGGRGQPPRTRSLEEPLPAIVPTGNHGQLVAAFLAQHNDGYYRGAGRSLREPAATVCASGSPQGVVAASLAKLRGTNDAADPRAPLHTVSAGGNHHALIAAFLQTYYANGTGQSPADPM